jgi:hypothetical protein
MIHRQVVLLTKAIGDLESAYRYAAAQAPVPATAWLERFQNSIGTLETRADGYPLAPENRRSPVKLQQMQFGRRANIYRVIYFVTPDAVYVVRILRAQRRFLTRREIRDAVEPGE